MYLSKRQQTFEERIAIYSKAVLIFSVLELVLLLLGKIGSKSIAMWSIAAPVIGFTLLVITTIPILILGPYIIFRKFPKKYKTYCLLGLTITFLIWITLLATGMLG